MKSIMTVNQNGTKEWKNKKGVLHREDGPAVEYADGSKSWYLNGQLHREDGPAIEYADGAKSWYLNGKEFSEVEFTNLSKNNFTEKPILLIQELENKFISLESEMEVCRKIMRKLRNQL